MYQWTTPTLTYQMPTAVDIDNAIDVYVSFSKNGKTFLTNKEPTIDGNNVLVELSQEESGAFPIGDVLVQLNWTFMENDKKKRNCTDLAFEKVKVNLYDKPM